MSGSGKNGKRRQWKRLRRHDPSSHTAIVSRSPFTCYGCDKVGHKVYHCPNKQRALHASNVRGARPSNVDKGKAVKILIFQYPSIQGQHSDWYMSMYTSMFVR